MHWIDGVFTLPHADRKKLKKMIEETIDMYNSYGSLKNLDAQALELIQEEVNRIVKDQAIQLPADYAYCPGDFYRRRAADEMNPDIDIVQWMKPKIKDWFGRASIAESIAKQYAKNAAEPLLSYPRAFVNLFAERGKEPPMGNEEKHYQRMKHQYYLLLSVSFLYDGIEEGYSSRIWISYGRANCFSILISSLFILFSR